MKSKNDYINKNKEENDNDNIGSKIKQLKILFFT